MCLAQGPQCSDAGEGPTRGPSVSSLALYHWATVLPVAMYNKVANVIVNCYLSTIAQVSCFVQNMKPVQM